MVVLGAVALFSSWFLAVVFAAAAVGKLADGVAATKAVEDFGFPPSLARPIGLLLPWIEAALAIWLLIARSPWWPGLAAMALLLAFTVVIVANLAIGRKPVCHCFGQIHAEPVGWKTLARNLLFATFAAIILSRGRDFTGPSVVQTAFDVVRTHPTSSLLFSGIGLLLFAQSWILLHLFRQHGRLLLRIGNLESELQAFGLPIGRSQSQASNSLSIGTAAPDFDLPSLAGPNVTLAQISRRGLPVLLFFSDPDCNPCNALLPQIAQWEREYSALFVIAILSRGSIVENLAKTSQYNLANVVLQKDREVADRFKVPGTPAAILILNDGTIGSQPAVGEQAITQLVMFAAGKVDQPPSAGGMNGQAHLPAAPLSLQIGEPAPDFRLPDLDGHYVELRELEKALTLVVFWNPHCGYCSAMLSDLRDWEHQHTIGGPKLLLISTGSSEVNRAMQLTSTILLDAQFQVGPRFGVTGTPSAVMLDAEKRIASTVAIGAPAIFGMVKGVAS